MQHNVSDHQIFCASLCPHVLLSVACFLPRTGNTFSTLRGHRFDWLLLRDEEATHQTSEPEAILHFVRFDDSSYETDPIIGALEARGYYGDTVLVEGVSTGTAKVSVRFVDRVWKVWEWGLVWKVWEWGLVWKVWEWELVWKVWNGD